MRAGARFKICGLRPAVLEDQGLNQPASGPPRAGVVKLTGPGPWPAASGALALSPLLGSASVHAEVVKQTLSVYC